MDFFKIYLVCFGVGFCFAMISLLFGEIVGGAGGHPGMGDHPGYGGHGGGSGSMPGISIFSPTFLASFLTAFGGLGTIFSHVPATSSVWLSFPLAALCGVGIAGLVLVTFNKVFRVTQGSSEGQVRNLIGLNATVLTPIAPGGVGEIAYVQGGTRYTAPARSQESCPIASGSTVCIVRVTPTEFYVAWI